MLWACIALPELALDVVRRSQPDPEAPLVLVDGPSTCRSLVAVNAAAARCGLRVGQKLTVARAIHADFIALPHDAAALPRWQQWLAAWAYRFSHQVCAAWPQAHSMAQTAGRAMGRAGTAPPRHFSTCSPPSGSSCNRSAAGEGWGAWRAERRATPSACPWSAATCSRRSAA